MCFVSWSMRFVSSVQVFLPCPQAWVVWTGRASSAASRRICMVCTELANIPVMVSATDGFMAVPQE